MFNAGAVCSVPSYSMLLEGGQKNVENELARQELYAEGIKTETNWKDLI